MVALGASDIWAVGFSQSGPYYTVRTLIEHWDGKQWNIIQSPNVGNGSNTLLDLAQGSVSDLWAVGSYFDVSHGMNLTLVEHWNGTTWKVVKSPNPGPAYDQLRGITSNAAGLWAVGQQATGATGQDGDPLVEFHC